MIKNFRKVFAVSEIYFFGGGGGTGGYCWVEGDFVEGWGHIDLK